MGERQQDLRGDRELLCATGDSDFAVPVEEESREEIWSHGELQGRTALFDLGLLAVISADVQTAAGGAGAHVAGGVAEKAWAHEPGADREMARHCYVAHDYIVYWAEVADDF